MCKVPSAIVSHGGTPLSVLGERATTPTSTTGNTADVQNRARQRFFMLAMLTKGSALGVARQAEQAWRLLDARCEPSATSRVVALRSKISDPDHNTSTTVGFEETQLISQWKSAWNTTLDESIKITCTSRAADDASAPKSNNVPIPSRRCHDSSVSQSCVAAPTTQTPTDMEV